MAGGKRVQELDEEVVGEFNFYWDFQLCFGCKIESLKRYFEELE